MTTQKQRLTDRGLFMQIKPFKVIIFNHLHSITLSCLRGFKGTTLMFENTPFVYRPTHSLDVLEESKKYLKTHTALSEKISLLGWNYQHIWKSIPLTTDNFFSGHFFPLLESSYELQISSNLCMLGFYKQAFSSLRSALELGMLSIYYNINDEGHLAVKDWLASKDNWDANTPKTKKIWQILLSNPNIQTFNDKFDIRARHSDLGYLNNYVHTKGYHYSNQGKRPVSLILPANKIRPQLLYAAMIKNDSLEFSSLASVFLSARWAVRCTKLAQTAHNSVVSIAFSLA